MAIYNYNKELPYRSDPDVHLLFWGREDCAPGHAVGPMVRNEYKIHFIHTGGGIVQIGGHTYSLGAGQAFLIYPNILTYYEADQQTPWSYSWLAFRGAQVETIIARTRLTPEHPIFPMDLKVMPDLYDQLTMAATEKASSDLLLKAIMYEFLSALVEVLPISASTGSSLKKHDRYIVQCMEFLHAHFNENISIQQLASFLGLDRKYLSALFKDSIGMPPQQYLLQYRMNKACELLRTSKYSVGEVAHSVGYQDALLFSKMFKKVKGVAPKHFR